MKVVENSLIVTSRSFIIYYFTVIISSYFWYNFYFFIYTVFWLLTVVAGTAEAPAVCALTSEPGYVIYSACGSFWVPMIIMVMFYARIYRTASRASAAVRRGFIHAADVTGHSTSRFFGHNQTLSPSKSENCIALRVHRGGAGCAPRPMNSNTADDIPTRSPLPCMNRDADRSTPSRFSRRRARHTNTSPTATSDFNLPSSLLLLCFSS